MKIYVSNWVQREEKTNHAIIELTNRFLRDLMKGICYQEELSLPKSLMIDNLLLQTEDYFPFTQIISFLSLISFG